MTDKIRLVEGIPVKFVDNGDGSYSVSSSGSTSGSTDVSLLSKEATQQQVLTAVQGSDVVVTGTIALITDELIINCTGKSVFVVQATGDFEGQLDYLVSTDDGANWHPMSDYNAEFSSKALSGVPYCLSANVGGFTRVRVYAVSATSGTATILMRASSAFDPANNPIGSTFDSPLLNATDVGTSISALKGILAAVQAQTGGSVDISTLAKEDTLNFLSGIIYNMSLESAAMVSDAAVSLTTLNAVSDWIDLGSNFKHVSKFELVLALTTAGTVPVVALEMDYSTDGTAIVRTPLLTGVVNRAVSLRADGRPQRVRCVVTTAGVTLGAGAKVIITGSK